jgi:hypothetical protein
MSRFCSAGTRCLALTRNIALTDSSFRKGPNYPQVDQYYRTCNICRGRPAVIPARRTRDNGIFEFIVLDRLHLLTIR